MYNDAKYDIVKMPITVQYQHVIKVTHQVEQYSICHSLEEYPAQKTSIAVA